MRLFAHPDPSFAPRAAHGRHGRDKSRLGDFASGGFGGPGFGRGAGGGGGGGGRVFGPGDLRLVLLALVAEQPRHGYELIKDIEQRFDGAYAPSPGSVYPTLTLLEELGHVSGVASTGSKKRYSVTDAGRAYLDENRNAVDGAMSRMRLIARMMSGAGTPPEAIYQAMHTLKAVLKFRRGAWTPAETERVRSIIERAAHDIGSEGDNDD
ncbi:PadR family transcriptional regulator [Solimonas marina]|uniref:Helix-turn-helix transcriptional regulator n=1 Tax=Solimonas marina TaxID=2714601 RepID=A0A969W852_9GAMM|nr:PadR family transcriptional regulator [Solimonas marina]NKF21244.1 helix-turn-helix transcriptional regulator [Solimonas marina]